MKSYFGRKATPVAEAAPAQKKRKKRVTGYPAPRVDYDELQRFVEERGSVTVADTAKHFKTRTDHIAYLRLEKLVSQDRIKAVRGEARTVPVVYVTIGKNAVNKRKAGRPKGAANGSFGDRVLQYISDNYGKTYSRTKMAEDLGTTLPQLSTKLKEYIKRGLVDRDFNYGDLATSKTPSQSAVQPKKGSNEATFNDVVETLIWEYVKATRSTDLLAFLTWLETKK